MKMSSYEEINPEPQTLPLRAAVQAVLSGCILVTSIGRKVRLPMRIAVNDPNITPSDFKGFCVGWRQPLDPETLFAALQGSYKYVIARDDSGKVIGFANAISDGVFAAFIPLVEVFPENQGVGVGTAIMRELLNELKDFRIVDLMCDPPLQEFYKTVDMAPMVGMRANRARGA